MPRIPAVLMLMTVSLVTFAGARADGPEQFSPWSEPVNLGPVINTAGNDSGPCISPDGLSLYFNSDSRGGFGGLDIFVSHRAGVGEPWGLPQNLGPNINSSAADNAPFLSPDGHRLYFQSARLGGFGGTDLYVARRRDRQNDFGWEAAENLGSMVNTSANDGGPVSFEDDETGAEMLYFFSTRAGVPGGMNIFASTLLPDESWGSPVAVTELNSPYSDVQPGMSNNGLEFLITSNRPGSFSSTADIWVSTRSNTSVPWSSPMNAGGVLNLPDPYFQGRPSLSSDRTELYFYAYRPGGYGAQDLYVSTRTKLRN